MCHNQWDDNDVAVFNSLLVPQIANWFKFYVFAVVVNGKRMFENCCFKRTRDVYDPVSNTKNWWKWDQRLLELKNWVDSGNLDDVFVMNFMKILQNISVDNYEFSYSFLLFHTRNQYLIHSWKQKTKRSDNYKVVLVHCPQIKLIQTKE